MKIGFAGSPLFSAEILEFVSSFASVVGVVSQPDTPQGRGQKLTPSAVKQRAIDLNIPVFESLDEFSDIDCLLVVAFGKIVPKRVLEKFICCNVHTSLLPRWRGAAPIQRAIMAGDVKTGVCLMKMDEGLDTGGIFAKAETEITDETTFDSLSNELLELSKQLLKDNLSKIISGELKPIPQPDSGITYAPKIKNEEAKIDFSKPAREVVRFINGLSSVPGAFTIYEGKRLKIFKASLTNTSELFVTCGDDRKLGILELQLEGKRRMSSRDFSMGHLDTRDLTAKLRT